MLSEIKSATLIGTEAVDVTVEVTSQKGLPREHIVGLPGPVIKESKNRIQSAIKHNGFYYPMKTYTINLAPAEIPKEGPFLDLPIAVALLDTIGDIEADHDAYYVGELSLSGDLKPIRGILSICQHVSKSSKKRLYLPYENANLAQLFDDIDIVPIQNLRELTDIFKGKKMRPLCEKIPPKIKQTPPLDFADVKGQLMGKRVLEIAAAGNHNVLFVGSPGSGKTMLLKRLRYILPELSINEAIETLKIKDVSRYNPSKEIDLCPPFRKPHHSISYAGLVGGGSNPKPGEISLAHLGILFLDEFPEFPRNVIEVLRQPLEDHEITLTRASFTISYPSKFMLVAAMNPCPCGYYLDGIKECQCQKQQIQKYWKKISGPILDRIDLTIEIPRLKKEEYFESHNSEENPYTTQQLKHRVKEARVIQYNRYKNTETNSDMSRKDIERYCEISQKTKALLGNVVNKGLLSGRGYDKVLKVARTIADLDQKENICTEHVMEALHYRKMN